MSETAAPQAPAVAQATRQLTPIENSGTFEMLLDTAKFAQLQRIGTMYARSKMVPAHFQGDEASCMVAVQMAMRMDIDPFMFLQKTYVVGGKPGMEGQMTIALINTRGPFEGPLDWNFKHDKDGKVIEATCFATHAKTKRTYSATITWETVVAEGWDKNKKWHSIREQMFCYRTAAFLGRRVCPEVLMGMSVEGEMQEIDITPPPEEKTEPRRTLKDRLGATAAALDAEVLAGQGGNPLSQPAEPIRKAAMEGRPPTTLDELVKSGAIVIHDDPQGSAPPVVSTSQPSQAGAGAPQGDLGLPQPQMPFDSLLGLAKRAKSREQGDIVLDALNDPGYTAEQRAEVKGILNSKAYLKEGQ